MAEAPLRFNDIAKIFGASRAHRYIAPEIIYRVRIQFYCSVLFVFQNDYMLRLLAITSKNKFIRCSILLLFIMTMFSPLVVRSAEMFDDWHDGDLVVEDRPGTREAALWSALHMRYNHIGIVRLTGGGPYVIDITSSASEVPLEDFVAHSKDGTFSVYRMPKLKVRQGVAVAAAAWQYSDCPRSDYLNTEMHSTYDAELASRAYQSIGVRLGQLQTVGSLSASNKDVLPIMLLGWKNNPTCKHRSFNRDQCIAKIMKMRIFVPAYMTSPSSMKLLYSGSIKNIQQ